ncbi:MAG: purine-nucleoside phosphorylase [bacterium]|nr:MAG: purine-nucleoside phosphorylase [bacterium]
MGSCAQHTLEPFYGRAELAVVLGSGLSGLTKRLETEHSLPFEEISGIDSPRVEGHSGLLTLSRIGGTPLLILAGRNHCYEGADFEGAGRCVTLASVLGCRRVLITNAAGSLHRGLPVGVWMLPSSIIAFPMRQVSRGAASFIRVPGDDRGGFRSGSGAFYLEPVPEGRHRRVHSYPDVPQAAGFVSDILRAASEANVTLPRGVLLWNPGPAFETKAEAHAALFIGADAVNMSALPELVAAAQTGIEAACLSWITNYTANVEAGGTDHAKVVRMGPKGVTILLRLLDALLSRGT